MALPAPQPPSGEPGSNVGWKYWAEGISGNLNRILDTLGTVQTDVQDIKVDLAERKVASKFFQEKLVGVCTKVPIMQRAITALKIKAGVWGLIAGIIPVTIALAYWIMSK